MNIQPSVAMAMAGRFSEAQGQRETVTLGVDWSYHDMHLSHLCTYSIFYYYFVAHDAPPISHNFSAASFQH